MIARSFFMVRIGPMTGTVVRDEDDEGVFQSAGVCEMGEDAARFLIHAIMADIRWDSRLFCSAESFSQARIGRKKIGGH